MVKVEPLSVIHVRRN